MNSMLLYDVMFLPYLGNDNHLFEPNQWYRYVLVCMFIIDGKLWFASVRIVPGCAVDRSTKAYDKGRLVIS